MGSNIPLAALHVDTAAPSPLAQYAQLQAIQGGQQQQQLREQQIQGAQQENQMRQLQLQDQQTLRGIAPNHVTKDASGNVTGFDTEGFLNEAAGKQVNPAVLTQMRNQYAESVKNLAGANEAVRNNEQAKNKALYETLESVREIQDPQQRQSALQRAIPNLQKQGVDTSALSQPNFPVDDKSLQSYEATLGMHAQVLADAEKQSEINKNAAGEWKELPSLGLLVNPVSGKIISPTGAQLTPAMMESKYVGLQQKKNEGQPLSDEEQAFSKAYEKNKTMVPLLSGQLRIQGQGAIRQFPVYDSQTKQTVYMDSNEINDAKLREPGRYTVPQFTPEAEIAKGTGTAFAPGGKSGQELKAFNTATLHADLLSKAATALDNGDVQALNSAKNALKTQFGSADVTNYDTIAKVYEHEVLKALGGHVTDAEVKSAGAMIPDNASPEQIKGAVNNLKALMNSKINVLRQQYEAGKSGQPAFPAGTTPSKPDGATHTGIGSVDKKKHWLDASGKDLGVAE